MKTKRGWKTTTCGAVAFLGNQLALFYPAYAREGAFVASCATGLGFYFSGDAPPPSGPPNGVWRATKLAALLAMGIVGLVILAGTPSAVVRVLPWRTF